MREVHELPGALWQVYNAYDADKIRDFLNKVRCLCVVLTRLVCLSVDVVRWCRPSSIRFPNVVVSITCWLFVDPWHPASCEDVTSGVARV